MNNDRLYTSQNKIFDQKYKNHEYIIELAPVGFYISYKGEEVDPARTFTAWDRVSYSSAAHHVEQAIRRRYDRDTFFYDNDNEKITSAIKDRLSKNERWAE